MTTNKEQNPHAKWLRLAADEMFNELISVWGNTCSQAADEISVLEQRLAAANKKRDDYAHERQYWANIAAATDSQNGALKEALSAAETALQAARQAGSLMSNLCFNLSQQDRTAPDDREIMRKLYRQWDEAIKP